MSTQNDRLDGWRSRRRTVHIVLALAGLATTARARSYRAVFLEQLDQTFDKANVFLTNSTGDTEAANVNLQTQDLNVPEPATLLLLGTGIWASVLHLPVWAALVGTGAGYPHDPVL